MADRAVFEFVLTDNTKPQPQQPAAQQAPSGPSQAPAVPSAPVPSGMPAPSPWGDKQTGGWFRPDQVKPPWPEIGMKPVTKAPPAAPDTTAKAAGESDFWSKLAKAPPPVPDAKPADPFNPYVMARQRLDRQEREKQVQDAMQDLNPPTLKPYIPKAIPVDNGGPGGRSAIPGLPGLGQAIGLPNGMGAALGNIAGPLAIAKVIEAKLKEAIARPAELAETGAEASRRLANNQFSGLSKPLEELPGAFGEAVKSANRVGKAFDEASDSFLRRAKQIGNYSGELATANAMAGVSRLRTDIGEAQSLGPELARMVTARAELDSKTAEALLPIKKILVEVLADAAETLTNFIEFIKPFIEANAEVLKILRGFMAKVLEGLAWIIDKLSLGYATDIVKALREFFASKKSNPLAVIDPKGLASNDRMESILRDIMKHMQAPPAVGVPRIF